MEPIKFAVPSGSVQDRTLEILRQAGYKLPLTIGRDYFVGRANGVEFYLRDREAIPILVARGTFGAGITGSDLRVNSEIEPSAVKIVTDLPYARVTNGATKWVLAAQNSNLPARGLKIGTERLGLARYCLNDMLEAGAELVRLSGKEESAVKDGLCDAVFVVTETGESLVEHNLKILRDNLFVSTPQLLASPQLPADELAVVEEIGLAMRAILDAELMVTVTFDLPRNQMEQLKLPAAISPTVNETLNPEWVAGQILIERQQLGNVLRQLNLVGACGVFMQDVEAYMA